MTKDNHALGKLDLNGIYAAPRGQPQIEVTFEVDVNGIVKVSAEDKGTGSKEAITIQADQNRLSKDEIDEMLKRAEQFADEDKKQKELVDARNELESYLFSLKTQLSPEGKLGGSDSKLSAEEKTSLESTVEEKLKWLEANSGATTEELKAAKKAVEDVATPILTKLYQDAGNGGGGESGSE